jgi:single-stranded-DNA-specific exonuclease
MTERMEEKFFLDLEKMAKEVKKREQIVVIHHYDADGITSGAIIIKALKREGKKVEHLCLKQVYKENIEEIKALGKNYLFVDFGSGQLNAIKELGKENIFVLDHHQVDTNYIYEKEEDLISLSNSVPHHINPLLYGIDGGRELSGSGTAFFFALALNKKNSDLVSLAIIGAVGDMQDFSGQLIGLNRKLLEIGEKEKLVSVKKDLRLYGRISRPLTSYLCFSSNPILPELTANQENCKSFLQQNQIPLKDSYTESWISYEDLNEEEKQRLSSALIIHLASFNVPEWKIKELIGEVYTLEKEEMKSPLRDAKEAATMCNSCGRHSKPEVALEVCLGNRNNEGWYGQALQLIDEHRRELRKGIEFIEKNGVEERKSFYFFDAKDLIQDSLVGIIAGMLYGSVIDENKAIIALARNEDDTIKISGRGTKDLVRKGLNLGKAFKDLEKVLPGLEGGGHAIAAGSKVPAKKIDLFLDLLEKKLSEQLSL